MRTHTFIDINFNNKLIKNTKTNSVIGNTLELKYAYASDDGIYFNRPIFDNIDDYIIIDKDEEISLRNYLCKNGHMSRRFILIGDNNKILDILEFQTKNHESFHTIPVSIEFADFIQSVGIDKLYILSEVLNYNINSICNSTIADDIILFLDSTDSVVRITLNKKRLEYISMKLDAYCSYKCDSGVTLLINNTFLNFYGTAQDRKNLTESINNNNWYFINNNKKYFYNTELQKYILNKIDTNIKIQKIYKKFYFEYLCNIFSCDFTIKDIGMYAQNVLNYGYVNDSILNKMNIELSSENRNEIL